LEKKFHRVGLACYPHFGDRPEKADVLASYGPATSLSVNEDYILLPIKGDKRAEKDPERIRQALTAIEGGRVPCIFGYIVERLNKGDDLFFKERRAADGYVRKNASKRVNYLDRIRPLPLLEMNMGEDRVYCGISVCKGDRLTRVDLMDLIESLDGLKILSKKSKTSIPLKSPKDH